MTFSLYGLLDMRLNRGIHVCLLLYAITFSWSVAAANACVDIALLLFAISVLTSKQKMNLRSLITTHPDLTLVAIPFTFVLISVVSGVFSISPMSSIRPTWFYLYHPLILPLALAFSGEKNEREKLLGFVIISVFTSSLYIIWQTWTGTVRPAGPTGILLLAATYLQMSIPFALVYFVETSVTKPSHSIGIGIVLVSALIASILSETRANWVAIASMFALFAILRAKKFQYKQLAALGIVLIIVVAIFASNPALKNRLVSISNLNLQSNSERLLIWQSAWNMFLDHPWLGVGPGNFGFHYSHFFISPYAKEIQAHAHNNVLQYFAEMGMLGGLYFCGMFAYVLTHYIKKYYANDRDLISCSMILSVAGFFVIGLMDWSYGMFPSSSQFFWFLVGVTWNWK